jgi:sugar/nucleoside kinase (ribokinase family)
LLTGITAFLPNENKLRGMFQGRSSDLWEMMEAISGYGCEIVVVKRGERGQYLYDTLSKARYIIPAYPAKVIDPTGAGDAYCGGFLAGYRRDYDPLQAGLAGNVSASFCVEGSGPFFTMEAMPRLAEARRVALKDMVRRV